MIEANPMLGMLLIMTPPKGTIYLKDKVALVKTKGLGYEIQHYHNTKTNQAFLNTTNLLDTIQTITSGYKPSEGYEQLFTEDKRVTAEKFTIIRGTDTKNIAGYPCQVSTYITKSSGTASGSMIPAITVEKLVVYTSKSISKDINFSHPFYLPEDNGILRIDIYLDKGNEPTMVYEMTEIKQTSVAESLLIPKKSTPLYNLTDPQYGMQLLQIMMGGLSIMDQQANDQQD